MPASRCNHSQLFCGVGWDTAGFKPKQSLPSKRDRWPFHGLWATDTHAVGGVAGLQLQISGKGKSWILRSTCGKKRRDVGLGAYPEIGVAEARSRAKKAKDEIRESKDPVLAKKTAKAQPLSSPTNAFTVTQAVKSYLDAKSSGCSNAKHSAPQSGPRPFPPTPNPSLDRCSFPIYAKSTSRKSWC